LLNKGKAGKIRIKTAGRFRRNDELQINASGSNIASAKGKSTINSNFAERRSVDHSTLMENVLNEPYTGPGDYDVPVLMGNNGIVYSHIKTPPHYTFSKTIDKGRTPNGFNRSMNNFDREGRSKSPLSNPMSYTTTNFKNSDRQYFTINHSFVGDLVTPGVGDYQIDNANLKKKAPKCTIGNYRRFVSTDKGQDYLKTTPVGY
jgi:hypothetical protein